MSNTLTQQLQEFQRFAEKKGIKCINKRGNEVKWGLKMSKDFCEPKTYKLRAFLQEVNKKYTIQRGTYTYTNVTELLEQFKNKKVSGNKPIKQSTKIKKKVTIKAEPEVIILNGKIYRMTLMDQKTTIDDSNESDSENESDSGFESYNAYDSDTSNSYYTYSDSCSDSDSDSEYDRDYY